jgi:CheY-like chemotaxis protein/HPt (histidine-containing phosphotransfer) domain-containing protein/anti-sigma regulatory factor (Ser/Thr protein kinase)
MNAILGLTHLGLKTELTNQQRDYLTKVEKSAEGLQDIVNSILDFSRLEEGELEIVNAPFKPGTLADDIEHAWRSVAQNAGLQMNITVDPGLPAALSGDRARLKQVLGNFLSNAIKFTKHGEVSLDIRLLQLQPDTATVRFAVSDTGMGISDEQREHLFDAFSQADNSMTRNFGGTGLGLAIAQQLVAKMGGDIALESSPGNGSTFSFALELPLSNIVAATAQETEPRSGEPVDLSPIQGARLLLVDDSDINLQVAGELLKQANLYVDVAHNGREAVDRVMSGNYECVLMDVQMPVMDGYTATETIRSDGRFEDLPILAMTANAMPQDRARGAQAGMNEYIPKPIEPDDLYRALLRWIPAGEREYKQPEDNAGVKNGPDSTELPETLPGIDIADGLKRVGGNAGLYRKLLQDMCQNYADVTSELQSLLDAERTEDARQLAHKLRGIANNLGASDVGTSAQAIELALKSDLAVEAQHISELADALRVVTGSQVSLVPLTGSAPMAGRFSDTELQGIFNEVLQGVDDNNPEALDIVTRLLSGIDEQGKGYAQTAAAHAALDMFAFASARNQLLELAEIRGWPIH